MDAIDWSMTGRWIDVTRAEACTCGLDAAWVHCMCHVGQHSIGMTTELVPNGPRSNISMCIFKRM